MNIFWLRICVFDKLFFAVVQIFFFLLYQSYRQPKWIKTVQMVTYIINKSFELVIAHLYVKKTLF